MKVKGLTLNMVARSFGSLPFRLVVPTAAWHVSGFESACGTFGR